MNTQELKYRLSKATPGPWSGRPQSIAIVAPGFNLGGLYAQADRGAIIALVAAAPHLLAIVEAAEKVVTNDRACGSAFEDCTRLDVLIADGAAAFDELRGAVDAWRAAK